MSTPGSSSNWTERIREEFNRSSLAVRVLAILSPTCPPCLYGKEVMKEIFDEFSTDKLRGFVVWIPMLTGDDAESAFFAGRDLQDPRVVQGWGSERLTGQLFDKALNLRRTAWDVYLLYASGVVWEENQPPSPTFWMHQLAPDSGADLRFWLNRGKFLGEVFICLKAISRYDSA
ncbi:MAG: hypothetical protein ACE5KH_04860 [Candidatus Geothermarchaeales archaeon]